LAIEVSPASAGIHWLLRRTVFEIFPESPTQFFARWRDHFLTFAEDTEGEVPHVLIRNDGVESKRVKKR
jgi:hypothetical protein